MYLIIGRELRDMITQLQEEKDEYENDNEIIHLAEKASELRSQLSAAASKAELAAIESLEKIADRQNEIDRLVLDSKKTVKDLNDSKLQLSIAETAASTAELAAMVSLEKIADQQNEIDRIVLDLDKIVKELNDSKLQLSTAALNAEVAKVMSIDTIAGSQKEIDRLAVDLDKVIKNSEELKILTEVAGTELVVALQSNKQLIEERSTIKVEVEQLNEDLSTSKNKIEQLEEEVAAKGRASLLSTTTTKNISQAIQASKISLALAAAQVKFTCI
jgi:DNA repair exonuclease SbcCD ATPase subunit